MTIKKHHVVTAAALSTILAAPGAWAADTLTEALTGGKVSANVQLRHESVEQNNALQDANATTVRARLGYETGNYKGFGAMLEAETLTALGNKSYDSKATGDSHIGTHSVVADPEATEINQAYLSYSGLANTTVKWGRQRIILDNARFVGNVGWRQNEQTFDAFTVVNKSLPDTTITAGYITNVNRVFSDNSSTPTTFATAGNAKMGSPIFNVSYKGWSFAEIVGYAYLLDYDINSQASFVAFSTDTYGIRLNGSAPMGGNKLLYTAEYARQSDGSNNTVDFKTNYMLLEGGIDLTGVAVFKVGYEVLGSDTGAITKATGLAAANKSFSTPLATLHAFNGWADMFLATPTNGLKDTYVSANTKLAGVNLGAVYHDYAADTGATSDLGNELNLVAAYTFDKNYTVGLKYADYSAGDLLPATYPDTKKTWLWGEFKF